MAFGALLGQTASGGGGKRVCRFTVGTSTSGWTANDCDYLCDGTADDVEINAAIQALPTEGGEIVILDGTYNITTTIAMNKDNVTLSGNGSSTVLKRMWNSSNFEGVIAVTATNGGCAVKKLYINGNKTVYTSSSNVCISLISSDNNTIMKTTCNNNNSYNIYVNSSNNNTIVGNKCSNGNNGGIYTFSSNNNTIIGNTCNNNNYGISVYSSDSNTVVGNNCNNNNYGIYVYSGNIAYPNNNHTITGNTCNNNNYGIYVYFSNNNTITGNTCNNNSNHGISLTSSNNNTITGNTCIRGVGQSSDYTSSQYTIYLIGTSNNYNLISSNNIMGKNYISSGGTNNTFVNNKYN